MMRKYCKKKEGKCQKVNDTNKKLKKKNEK